jgi:hypothetical protein
LIRLKWLPFPRRRRKSLRVAKPGAAALLEQPFFKKAVRVAGELKLSKTWLMRTLRRRISKLAR